MTTHEMPAKPVAQRQRRLEIYIVPDAEAAEARHIECLDRHVGVETVGAQLDCCQAHTVHGDALADVIG